MEKFPNLPNQKEYKDLTPFDLVLIQKFPFIEEDFDAINLYGILSKIKDYLNKVIANEQIVTENQQNVYNSFTDLYNYVEDYFTNLDVQEEINNKLDEMLENGSLESLIIKYFKKYEVSYEQFGAKGDGVTDDFQAILNTHIYANENNLKVIAQPNASYYINNITESIPVLTDVDWKNANFIIDDNNLINIKNPIFEIKSKNNEINCLGTILSVNAHTLKIPELANHGECLVEIVNDYKKDYIRTGGNTDEGFSRTEFFRIDNEGNVLDDIYFDFNVITKLSLYPIDKDTITIKNGNFNTLVNVIDSYNYYYRNIKISRSNVIIENINHKITGENETLVSSPYEGFIFFNRSVNCELKDCCLSAHKIFRTEQNVQKGSYDLQLFGSIDIFIENLKQYNSINNSSLWGISTSNYSKKLHFNNCEINRIDAHKGVYDININDCTIGFQSIKLIGCGKAVITNTNVYSYQFIELRADYGSTWDGKIIIKNCKLIDNLNNYLKSIIRANNQQNHDYGYKCYFPELEIDGFEFLTNNNSLNSNFAPVFIQSDASIIDYSKNYEENNENNCFPYIIKENYIFNNIKSNIENNIIHLFDGYNIVNFYSEKIASADNTQKNKYQNLNDFITNMNITIKNINFRNEIDENYLAYRNTLFGNNNFRAENYNNTYRVIAFIDIINCKNLALGFSGIPAQLNIKNSELFLLRAGYNGAYVIANLINSKLLFKYKNNEFSNSNFYLDNYCYSLENCEFIKLSEFTVDNILTTEIPIRDIRRQNNELNIRGLYSNLKFWDNFLNELENNTSVQDFLNSYDFDLTYYFNNNSKKYLNLKNV